MLGLILEQGRVNRCINPLFNDIADPFKGHSQGLEVIPLTEGVQGANPLGAVSQVIKSGSNGSLNHVSGMAIAQQIDKTAPEEFQQVALDFVIFDLESNYVLAWAIAVREFGWLGYAQACVFVGVVLAALACPNFRSCFCKWLMCLGRGWKVFTTFRALRGVEAG